MAEDSNDALAAAELIESLEEWFCQGAVTSRVGDLLSEIARQPAFEGFADDATAATDEGAALERSAAFSRYSELIDFLLDHFTQQLVDGDAARQTVMQDIAATVVALVGDESMQHLTCVPFIAGALDIDHFHQLVSDTQNMLGPTEEATPKAVE
jgi:hypothetical protein